MMKKSLCFLLFKQKSYTFVAVKVYTYSLSFYNL